MSLHTAAQNTASKINKSDGQGAILVLGEACSELSGLPSSDEFLEIIKATYPDAHEKATTKDLIGCCSELPDSDRDDLLAKQEKKAKINWAHLAVALLMKKGLVSRVLTLNPDSLLLKACSLVGVFPHVFDCTLSTVSSSPRIPENAVFFLNGRSLGQATGNMDAALAGLSDHQVVVIGHKAEANDEVAGLLSKSGPFSKGFLWVKHGQGGVPESIDELLEDDNGDCVESPDPDTFMIALAQQLDALSPNFLNFPFTHLGGMLKSIAPFPVEGIDAGIQITDIPLFQTRQAIQQFEGENRGQDVGAPSLESLDSPEKIQAVKAARTALVEGDLKKILDYRPEYDQNPNSALGDLLSLAYLSHGDALLEQAQEKGGDASFDLLSQAGEQYSGALEITPDNHEVLFKLGKLLVEQAKLKSGADAENLFGQAAEKYQKALELKPDLHEANYGWGFALLEQAASRTDETVDQFFAQATEKFQAVLKAEPEHGGAAYGCGFALFSQARKKKGAEALRLYGQAAEKLNTALKVDPHNADALLHMGQSLLVFSKSKKGEEQDRMLAATAEKFQSCVKLRPNSPEAFFGWADALLERGLARDDGQGEEYCSLAMEKFQTVLALKPDMPRVNFRWGVGLLRMARRKSGDAASKLLNQAAEKFQNAIRIVPTNHEAFTKLGSVYSQLAQGKSGPSADALLSNAVENYEQAIKIQPNNPEAFTLWGNVFYQLADGKQGIEAEAFLYKAIEKFQEAIKIRADYLKAISNWGNALFKLGKSKGGEEGMLLLSQAEGKYEAAIKIKPDDPLALTNFGGILLKKARKAEGGDADLMIEKAQDYLKQALEYNEDNPDALTYMSEVLMEQAKSKKGINAHPLLAEAKAKLQKAEELQPGVATYTMAKLMGQLANESGCREWLQKCKTNENLPPQEELDNEPAFANMAQSKWFKGLWLPASAREAEPKEGDEGTAGKEKNSKAEKPK
ncbi:MAG: tetratricopeptide repeat protein [Candidatus Nitronauta litoralis]|uniref:Tetratricopeptide repeat protein n=1 Tax=Candidatus Nitronauta litoralis TaxID=2705533 RepID=A0A7T0BTV4_9BACT|nr:MAG: tetratricopeptide repeat protein [Candidatus Nitronauta litoralis]